jgi:hypothetical protein
MVKDIYLHPDLFSYQVNSTLEAVYKLLNPKSGGVSGSAAEMVNLSAVHPRDQISNLETDRKYFLILLVSHFNLTMVGSRVTIIC